MPSRIVKWLIGLVVANIFWVSGLSLVLIVDNANESDAEEAQRQRDCLNTIALRDLNERQDVEQWVAASEWLAATPDGGGGGPGGEVEQRRLEFIATQSEFIARQYDSLPPPASCLQSER